RLRRPRRAVRRRRRGGLLLLGRRRGRRAAGDEREREHERERDLHSDPHFLSDVTGEPHRGPRGGAPRIHRGSGVPQSGHSLAEAESTLLPQPGHVRALGAGGGGGGGGGGGAGSLYGGEGGGGAGWGS